jgi:hypothetical protein
MSTVPTTSTMMNMSDVNFARECIRLAEERIELYKKIGPGAQPAIDLCEKEIKENEMKLEFAKQIGLIE